MYVRLHGIRLVKKKLLELFLVCLTKSTVDNSKKLEKKCAPSKVTSNLQLDLSLNTHTYIHINVTQLIIFFY